MLRRAARGLTHTVRVYILATFPGYTPIAISIRGTVLQVPKYRHRTYIIEERKVCGMVIAGARCQSGVECGSVVVRLVRVRRQRFV